MKKNIIEKPQIRYPLKKQIKIQNRLWYSIKTNTCEEPYSVR